MNSAVGLVCGVCKTTKSSFFIVVGNNCVCTDCKRDKTYSKKVEFQAPPVFTRYICKTHNCGTYSVNNMMFRHSMDDCVIVAQNTLGIIRPATYGGLNGDIGRTHFLGVNEMVRLKVNLQNYKKFVYSKKKISMSRQRGKDGNFHDKKYYNKHLFFVVAKSNIDFHRSDELFAKIKFNLKVYGDNLTPKHVEPRISKAERNAMYYKNLVKNFKTQVAKN